MMPKVDGITLSYKLKSDVRTKHIPIFISTAKDLSEEERKSLNNIVEEIAVKSKGHPLDVLKVVRDRIKQQEAAPQMAVDVESDGFDNANDSDRTNDVNQQEEVIGTVLIVDDDPDTLFTIDEMVQECNCNTFLAKNGVECLEMLNRNIPDLVLLDIMMPEMDGFQTIKRIRSDVRFKNIPVFAVTARAMSDDKEVILRHGFDDYIPKPVKSSIITSKIKELFTKIRV